MIGSYPEISELSCASLSVVEWILEPMATIVSKIELTLLILANFLPSRIAFVNCCHGQQGGIPSLPPFSQGEWAGCEGGRDGRGVEGWGDG